MLNIHNDSFASLSLSSPPSPLSSLIKMFPSFSLSLFLSFSLSLFLSVSLSLFLSVSLSPFSPYRTWSVISNADAKDREVLPRRRELVHPRKDGPPLHNGLCRVAPAPPAPDSPNSPACAPTPTATK